MILAAAEISVHRPEDTEPRPDRRNGAPESSPRTNDLCRRFCEELISEAVSATGGASAHLAELVDWREITPTTWGLETDERSIGRAVLLAARTARRLREAAEQMQPPSPTSNGARVARDLGSRDLLVHPVPTLVPGPALVPGQTAATDALSPPVSSRADLLRAQRRYRTLRRAYVGFGWLRNVGLILMLFAAWQMWGTSIEHAHDQASLRQQFQAHPGHMVASPARGVIVASTVRLPEPPEGSVVAHLQIPAIGVDQYVVEGTAEGDLAKGPGHYIGTAAPGQSGNVAIAGHRTTYGAPFNRLDQLVPGDPISLTTPSGELLTYVVAQPPAAVPPHDVSILNTFSDNRLTLTTCNPKFSASQRLIVVATLRLPAATPVPKVVPHKVNVVVGSTGWNFGYLPGALAILVLLALLGLANKRARGIYGEVGRWLVLTPIWAAALCFLFIVLTKLLPATL